MWVNCLKSLKKPSICLPGKTPSAPSVWVGAVLSLGAQIGYIPSTHSRGFPLGAEGVLPDRQIEGFFWDFKQFARILPSRQIESWFKNYSPLWSQFDRWVNWEHFLNVLTTLPIRQIVSKTCGFFHKFDQCLPMRHFVKETCGFFHNYDHNLPNTYPEPLIMSSFIICSISPQTLKELMMSGSGYVLGKFWS